MKNKVTETNLTTIFVYFRFDDHGYGNTVLTFPSTQKIKTIEDIKALESYIVQKLRSQGEFIETVTISNWKEL